MGTIVRAMGELQLRLLESCCGGIRYQVGHHGADDGPCKAFTLLNRAARWRCEGKPWGLDPSHNEFAIRHSGLQGVRHVITPGVGEQSKVRELGGVDGEEAWVRRIQSRS